MLFFSSRSLAPTTVRKQQQKGGGRIVSNVRCRPTLETLESRLAPATASLSFGSGVYQGNGAGGTIMDVPIDVSPLSAGFASASIVVSYATGVFNFPTGGGAAGPYVRLGSIPSGAGGPADWNLAANATADGDLNISLFAKPGHLITTNISGGSLVLINFPVSASFAPAAPTNETIKIVAASGATHTQMVGSGGGYTLSPAPPYLGTVTILPAAGTQPLIRTPQSYTTDANTTLQQTAPDLLTGASDPQGLNLAVNTINGSSYTDGTPLTLPSGATLTINNGDFTYVPANNFAGTDSFTFSIQDQAGNVSQPGTVNITVVPTLSIVPKTISSGQAGTVIEEDVYLENPNPVSGVGPLIAFNLGITYDATALTAGAVVPGPDVPADWSFLAGENTAGIIGIGAFGTGQGPDLVLGPAPFELAAIDFVIVSNTAASAPIVLVSAAQTRFGTLTTGIVGVGGSFPLGPVLGPQGSAFIPGVDTTIAVLASPSLTISPAALPGGEVGVPYQQTMSAGGGTGPYRYTLAAGTLPAGLTLNGSTGVLAGTPTVPDDYSFVVSASDAATVTSLQSYTVTIASVLTISTVNLPSGAAGTSYEQTLIASGGSRPFVFSTASGTLPPGLTFGADGVLSGTPNTAGTFTFTVAVSDRLGGSASRPYMLIIATIGGPIVLSPTSLPDGILSTLYSEVITAFGGERPCTFAVTAGTLPTGLTLFYDGVLQGTPRAVGTFSFTVTATDIVGGSASQTYTLMIDTASVSGLFRLPSSGYGGSVTSPVMNFPVNITALTDGTHTGLAAATVVLTYPVGVFGVPTGGDAASLLVSLGSIPLANGGTAHWQLAANSPADGLLVVTLSANRGDAITSISGGSLVTINFPVVANPSAATPETITVLTSAGSTHTSLVGSNGTYIAASLGLPTSGVITINPVVGGPLALGPNTQPYGDVAVAYSRTIAAFGGAAPYTFATTSGTLPPGLTLSTGGVLAGTPTTAGMYIFTVTVTDATSQTASQSYTVTINPAVVVPAATLENGAPGVAYHHALVVTGGSGPYTFSYSGTLPPGITLDSTTGVLSGTPAADGRYAFMVTATDSLGTSVSQSYTITIPAAAPVATAYVDPNFTGSGDPATDPGLGLTIGVNAFSTITAALPHVTPGGTLVLFGGTYNEPAVDFTAVLGAINIETNSSDTPASSTVTIASPMTLSTSETFTTVGGSSAATNILFGSTVDGPGGLTVIGGVSLALNGNAGSGTPLGGISLTDASSVTLGPGVTATVGTLASTSSGSSIVLDAGTELITGSGGSSTFAGTISGAGELSKTGPTTSLTLSGSNSYTGPTLVVGTLTINGTLGATTSPLSLVGPSSILSGSGTIQRPVIVTGTASGAQIEGVSVSYTLQPGTTVDIDIQAGADNVAISGINLITGTIGIVIEPGSGNHLSITGSTIRNAGQGLEVLNGIVTATGNSLVSNNVAVEIPATNPNNASLPVNPLLTVEGNVFQGSSTGLMNASTMGVTALFNWWGSAAGPATGQVVGISVDEYTPYALDATSAGPSPTALDFFNGTGADGNVYVTGTLGADAITATVDATNANLIHIGGPNSGDDLRGGAGNRIIIYGFGENAAGAHDTISVAGSWDAEIHVAALAYREPLGFSGLSRSTIPTTGTGSDVIFGGGNDSIAAMTSGNNVLVAGLSSGKTAPRTAPQLSGGSGANVFIAGSVDGTLAPLAASGRLDYATLRAMDDLWASGAGDANDAMNAAALFDVANTLGAIPVGTARAVIVPGSGQSWLVAKGGSNPSNTPTAVNNDYVAASSATRYYRQAIL
jgi:Putative Ig domain/Bacterial Ig domain